MRIAVWRGGESAEREVSRVSGAAVAEALRGRGHDLLSVEVGTDLLEALDRTQKAGTEVVFVALHGGAGEDGRVQALLEVAGLPYTGSGPGASAVAMDKIWSKRIARDLEVRTAEWREVSEMDDELLLSSAESFGYPLVLKPVAEGSAVGVVVARDEQELRAGLRPLAPRRGRWMVERYIGGREITAPVVEGEVLPLIEIRPQEGFYDYRHKYTEGCTEYDCPAGVTEEERAAMVEAARRLWSGLRLRDMGRLDFRLDEEGRDFFLEANTIPGMTGTSLLPMGAAAVGLDFGTLCERLCEAALRRRR